MSDLSDSLTGAHLSWATWVIRSQSLISPETSEQIAHSFSFKWAILSKLANEQLAKEQIPNPACMLGCSDLALFTIFEKLHISADQD